MCGTDGATYENVCVLRSLSANARVDYRGECIDINGTVDKYCQAVLDQGLCPYIYQRTVTTLCSHPQDAVPYAVRSFTLYLFFLKLEYL